MAFSGWQDGPHGVGSAAVTRVQCGQARGQNAIDLADQAGAPQPSINLSGRCTPDFSTAQGAAGARCTIPSDVFSPGRAGQGPTLVNVGLDLAVMCRLRAAPGRRCSRWAGFLAISAGRRAPPSSAAAAEFGSGSEVRRSTSTPLDHKD